MAELRDILRPKYPKIKFISVWRKIQNKVDEAKSWINSFKTKTFHRFRWHLLANWHRNTDLRLSSKATLWKECTLSLATWTKWQNTTREGLWPSQTYILAHVLHFQPFKRRRDMNQEEAKYTVSYITIFKIVWAFNYCICICGRTNVLTLYKHILLKRAWHNYLQAKIVTLSTIIYRKCIGYHPPQMEIIILYMFMIKIVYLIHVVAKLRDLLQETVKKQAITRQSTKQTTNNVTERTSLLIWTASIALVITTPNRLELSDDFSS